jgi:hypothetical protein
MVLNQPRIAWQLNLNLYVLMAVTIYMNKVKNCIYKFHIKIYVSYKTYIINMFV